MKSDIIRFISVTASMVEKYAKIMYGKGSAIVQW